MGMGLQSDGPAVDSEQISEALGQILDSVPFRSSKQCQDLLRYVVEHSIRHDDLSLKERIIGCEVFGRSPDYNTSDDPVVRVRAGEVRKRLALFYRTIPHNSVLEMDIPHGSYRVVFRRPSETTHPGLAGGILPPALEGTPVEATWAPGGDPGAAKPDAEHTRDAGVSGVADSHEHSFPDDGFSADKEPDEPKGRPWILRNWRLLATLVLASISLAMAFQLIKPRATAFTAFWNPILTSPKGPIIYVGSSAVYRATDKLITRYASEHQIPLLENGGREFIAKLVPGENLTGDDLVPDLTNFVTIGDTAAVSSIGSMLARAKKPYDLRFSDDIAFGDLRQSPIILIGAFNNTWTIQMDDRLPFIFRASRSIQEVGPPHRSWSTLRDNRGNLTDDYSLVCREWHSKSGQVAFTVAGLDMTGTRGSAEFVTDPVRMNQALKELPVGWQEKNLQLLLHSTIINGLPSGTEIVAYRVW